MSMVIDATAIVNSAIRIDSWGMKEFGKLVREAREQLGMRSYELADAIGKQRSYVSRLEAGELKETPPPDDLRRIRRTLNVSMRSLLVSLGYVDADEPEPGIAYMIREDDPRADLLALTEGLSSQDVEAITGAMSFFVMAVRGHDRPGGDMTAHKAG